jgi:hypothetical protein
MEVKIGVIHASRELTIDPALDGAEVEELIRSAVESGGLLSISDAKGRRIVVPVEKLAYVEVAAGSVGPVGFRS